MKNGGAWMGFHFSAFALTPSKYPQDWDWYHDEFLGSGMYVGNTWRPTSWRSFEWRTTQHPATVGIAGYFPEGCPQLMGQQVVQRSEDQTEYPDPGLRSIRPASPLGTGPKMSTKSGTRGYYPVVWTNQKYRMIYFNMGHNDLDFGQKPNKVLSSTFASEPQNRLVLDGLLWLGASKTERAHFGKTCVAVLRNKSRAAHWSPLVHCTMKMATIPVLGLTDKSVP